MGGLPGRLIGTALLLLAGAAAGEPLAIPAYPFQPPPAVGDRVGEAPAARVGRDYWYRPKDPPFSADFSADPRLSDRLQVEGPHRLRIEAVIATGPDLDPQYVYRLRFDDGTEAFIAAADFEAEYYADPGDLSATHLGAGPGTSAQEYLFERRSFFAEDPELLRQRLQNRGPRRLRSGPGR